ncbi:MAG TPA: hypothetical protein VF857_06800, partial [Spirochaetota bacterium]
MAPAVIAIISCVCLVLSAQTNEVIPPDVQTILDRVKTTDMIMPMELNDTRMRAIFDEALAKIDTISDERARKRAWCKVATMKYQTVIRDMPSSSQWNEIVRIAKEYGDYDVQAD